MSPLCFVLMPFGVKPNLSGLQVNFDAVYAKLIRPAIEAAGMEPIRADAETFGGLIHRPMFERLLLCDYAVADLTSANANVFYELGVRHAVRPHTTALVFADGERLPFDVAPNRALPYRLSSRGTPTRAASFVEALAERLTAARTPATDSPIYELLGDWPELSHTKTDVFRDRVDYERTIKESLAAARSQGSNDAIREAVAAVEASLSNLHDVEVGVLVDLLLSYRAGAAWGEMIRLVEQLPPVLARQTLVREQYGLALNRDKLDAKAERVLTTLIRERGATPETCGILGRVYKDRWRAAVDKGEGDRAAGYLRKAIDTYLRGFQADWRDHYPGVNAVQLIHAANPNDPRLDELIPVVRYAVERKIASGAADYWDHATLLELAVLRGDRAKANAALADALAQPHEGWMTRTTADTLADIANRVGSPWLSRLVAELQAGD